jgi:hypothetical protein
MIQALPAKRADDALNVSPLLGGSWCTKHLFDAHVLKLSGEAVAKDSIPVSQQIARCRVPGERIAKLQGRPFRGRMSRHVEVQNASPFMGQDQEYVQHLEANCGHSAVGLLDVRICDCAGQTSITHPRPKLKQRCFRIASQQPCGPGLL